MAKRKKYKRVKQGGQNRAPPAQEGDSVEGQNRAPPAQEGDSVGEQNRAPPAQEGDSVGGQNIAPPAQEGDVVGDNRDANQATATPSQLALFDLLKRRLKEKPSEEERQRRLLEEFHKPRRYQAYCSSDAVHFILEGRFVAENLSDVLVLLKANLDGARPVVHLPWETIQDLDRMKLQGYACKLQANAAASQFLRIEAAHHTHFHGQTIFEAEASGLVYGNLTKHPVLQMWYAIKRLTGRPEKVIVLSHDSVLDWTCNKQGARYWTPQQLKQVLTAAGVTGGGQNPSGSVFLPRYAQTAPPFVICGPSGSGKSRLIRMLLEEHPDAVRVVPPHTTWRPPAVRVWQPTYLVARPTFEIQIAKGIFVEYASVEDELWGTTKLLFDAARKKFKVCLLQMQIPRVEAVRETNLNPVYICVKPSTGNQAQAEYGKNIHFDLVIKCEKIHPAYLKLKAFLSRYTRL